MTNKGGPNDAIDDTRSRAVLQRYRDRLGVLRKAQEYSQKGDMARAVSAYIKYLEALAGFHNTEEKKLGPHHFHKEKDLTELLLISQVYWDLAKIYDRNSKFHNESERCLQQFVKFSQGFKYQYVNSEILRKFMRKKMAYNLKAFERAYEKIGVRSRGCFIASRCYGIDHPKTDFLRRWRQELEGLRVGRKLVGLYYHISPRILICCDKHPNFGQIFIFCFIRPLIDLLVLMLIIRVKCRSIIKAK